MRCKKCGERIPFWRKRRNGMHVKCNTLDTLDTQIELLERRVEDYQKEYREMLGGRVELDIEIVEHHSKKGIKMWSSSLMKGVIIFAPKYYQRMKKCAIELGWEGGE